jgi:hypothetical protein
MSGGTGDANNLPNDGNTQYGPFFGSELCATESECATVLAVGGTVSNLYVKSNLAPGLGDTWTFTIFKNGVADTSVQCTISGALATTCNDLTGSITFAAGDTISIRALGAGSPVGNAEASWSVRYA